MLESLRIVTDPLVDKNPVTVHILGICSALAVTTSVATALTLSLALIVVLTLAAGIISLIRHHVPSAIRLIVQITIIASLVVVADQLLQAFAYEMSQRLSVFVSLIATNCIVLGRTEAFALQNRPVPSMLDALGNGAGYALVLLVVASIRELFGSGTLLALPVLPLVADGGWYEPMRLMLLAPSAFIILGLLVWAIRSLRPGQQETPEFSPLAQPRQVQP
ncbi:Na+-transporting NADH:ubiquinone oxidoreductase subunit D [Devosia enhydra]|uniref:Na+-transporting NADH:ubiquinone oxidoreductase subunit D n=2 Tax=Devosia enhydra TaxID=665118 RepID=A0A1K2HSU2_9HYPH|nr:NADH:ubiquinone reductase (Na(+)-transporting) subunit D [Devosia enhydra]SFZ80842.1 Na+-transporting NADH:ubiquinone oxidoreductase subunit D [Devosia enhydra]